MSDTKVTLTIEPEEHGYCQHVITLERAGLDFGGGILLTDGELAQLECLLANYKDAKAMGAESTAISFYDSTGRPPVIQEEHGPFGVVS